MDTKRGRRTYRFASRYELENRTDRAAHVRVLDTVPVSEVKDVTITIDRKKSSKFRDLGAGILSFDMVVAPKKTANMELRYTISVPESLSF